MAASRGSRVVCRRCGLEVADAGRKPRDGKIILRNIQVRVRGDWVKMADNLQIINSKPLKRILLLRTKNGKSKDYCKADWEQRVLFFEHNNISPGHTSLFQVYRCYWTGGGGKVSQRKSLVQSPCQYDVMSRVSVFQNGEQSVHRRDG